jgi:5-methylcytosine-specific restriction enzyme subunit McrC
MTSTSNGGRGLALLFQSFVLNFLRQEQSAFHVARRAVHWSGLSGSLEALGLIPLMLTDVSLERGNYTAVIETKYYRQPFVEHRGARRVRSGHLYQLYAYVTNLSQSGRIVDGVLLYAQADEAEDVVVTMQGHRFRILTLDLSATWEEIHFQLAGIAQWAEQSSGTGSAD